MERAKASAAVWEARLKVTEFSRAEYREAARGLAHNNVELTQNQYQLEKDMLEVIGFLKKQDEKKDEMVRPPSLRPPHHHLTLLCGVSKWGAYHIGLYRGLMYIPRAHRIGLHYGGGGQIAIGSRHLLTSHRLLLACSLEVGSTLMMSSAQMTSLHCAPRAGDRCSP